VPVLEPAPQPARNRTAGADNDITENVFRNRMAQCSSNVLIYDEHEHRVVVFFRAQPRLRGHTHRVSCSVVEIHMFQRITIDWPAIQKQS
jgi:hypothetical protein